MSNFTTIRSGLRDNDIFQQFIDLLTNEKSQDDTYKAGFDIIIENITTIKNIIEANTLNDDYSRYDPLDHTNYESIKIHIYYKYLKDKKGYSGDEGMKHALSIQELSSISGETYENFIEKENDYYLNEIINICNKYLFNSISLILERYLHFYDTLGFIRDELFYNNFQKYTEYLKNFTYDLQKISYHNQQIFDTVIFFAVNPLINVNRFLERANPTTLYLKNYFKLILNDDIFKLTRNINSKTLANFHKSYPEYVGSKQEKSKIYSSSTENSYPLEIPLTIKIGNKDEQSNLFLSMFLIIKSVEGIKGVDIEIITIEKGSLIGKFKVTFKDIVAKEEFKTVVRNGTEIAGKMLADTSLSETTKNYAEADKAKEEVEEIKRQIASSLSPEDATYKNQIGIERDLLENEKIQAELRILDKDEKIKELELKIKQVEYIQKLSQLFGKGVLEVDALNISLNELPILIKENGQLEVGNIDEAIK